MILTAHERGHVVVERLDAGDRVAMPLVTDRGRPDFGATYAVAREPGIVVRVATGAGAAFVSDRVLGELGYQRLADPEAPEVAS